VTLAIIGGSGLYALEELELEKTLSLLTPYAQQPVCLYQYRKGLSTCLFLPRHGAEHQLAPHEINYRANLWALDKAGASSIVAVNATGAVDPCLEPGSLVLPDQIIDYTYGRENSFYLGKHQLKAHIDFSEPFTPELNTQISAVADSLGLPIVKQGTYGVTQGPRLETGAEIRRLARDGCTLVGMTAMPEAALARELGIPYASLCLVINKAAGVPGAQLNHEFLMLVLEEGIVVVKNLLRELVSRYSPDKSLYMR
jgi:5'-methylthioinosine phosphorylase